MTKAKKRSAAAKRPRRRRGATDVLDFEPDDGVVPPPDELAQPARLHPFRRVQVVLELETDAPIPELSKAARYQIDIDGGLEGCTCRVLRARARAVNDG